MAEQEKSGLEIFEAPENLQTEFSKVEGIFNKNKSLFTYIGIGVLALAAAIAGYNYWKTSRNTEGQAALAPAVFAMEADSLNKALKGTGANLGLLAIAEDFSGTDAGNLAHFYAGIALLKQGKYDDAIAHLGDFKSNDLIMQARAFCLIGDAYADKKNYADAISYYEKAIGNQPNDQFTPGYMQKLAFAQEAAKDNKGALETYAEMNEKYPSSQASLQSKRFEAKLKAAAGE
jgi:TolA-binding protein